MSSGVAVNDECLNAFQELKESLRNIRMTMANARRCSVLSSTRHTPLIPDNSWARLKYIIYKLDNPTKPTEIVVAKKSENTDYDEFLEELADTECCFAVYDFLYNKGEGDRNKLCFFIWAPDNAKIKQKMVYASSKDSIRRALVGIGSDIQGTDHSEVAYDNVLEKVSRGK